MTFEDLELDGWDRDGGVGGGADDDYASFIRDDRKAKITIKPVTFAVRGDGWMATLWLKERPHGRSWRETSVAGDDVDEFVDKVRDLAREAVVA